MFVISFGGCLTFFWRNNLRSDSARSAFHFAWQVGETKPYGKNVSLYDISICLQVRETDRRAELKYGKGARKVKCANGVLLVEELF